MCQIVIRIGRHLDRVEEKVDALCAIEAKVDAVHADVYKENWNLKQEIRGVRHDTEQVKCCVTAMNGDVKSLFDRVDMVRDDVTKAIDAGNADREQAFYSAASQNWGPWTIASAGIANPPGEVAEPEEEVAEPEREAGAEAGAGAGTGVDVEYYPEAASSHTTVAGAAAAAVGGVDVPPIYLGEEFGEMS